MKHFEEKGKKIKTSKAVILSDKISNESFIKST
jgi:hypothetical protein